MIRIKIEVIPSKRKKNKNYRKTSPFNEYLENSRDEERSPEIQQDNPIFDKIRQGLTNPDTKDEVKKTLDSMALKMILSIEVAIMKYIKDNS